MTTSEAAKPDATAEDNAMAAHLAAIAQLHAAALAHIAALAEPWLRWATSPGAASPDANHITTVSAVAPPLTSGKAAA